MLESILQFHVDSESHLQELFEVFLLSYEFERRRLDLKVD